MDTILFLGCYSYDVCVQVQKFITLSFYEIKTGHRCLVPDIRGKSFQLVTVEYNVSCGLVIDAQPFLCMLLYVYYNE